VVNTEYCFFPKGAEKNITNADQLSISHTLKELDYAVFIPKMVEGAEKIRTIAAKESNYFNILQNIAETFEVWLDLEVEHDESGAILSKKIAFHNYLGK
jgi:hypothetical protein